MIETLPISGSVSIAAIPSRTNRLERALGGAEVLARDRERHLGVATLLARLVLDDRVDVAVGVGERPEDRRRRAGAVGNTRQRDPRLFGRVGHCGDKWVLHRLVFSDHEGTGDLVEARAAVDPHAVGPSVLDRSQLQDLGPGRRHLEHLLEADLRQFAGVGHEARVGREHSRHVGVDLAHLGADRGRQRHRGGVRAAAAERGHIAAGGDALEPGDQHDQVVVQRLADPVGAHLEDPGLGV